MRLKANRFINSSSFNTQILSCNINRLLDLQIDRTSKNGIDFAKNINIPVLSSFD